jgi:hypothetical protein
VKWRIVENGALSQMFRNVKPTNLTPPNLIPHMPHIVKPHIPL